MGRSLTYVIWTGRPRAFRALPPLAETAGLFKGERFAIMLPRRAAVSDAMFCPPCAAAHRGQQPKPRYIQLGAGAPTGRLRRHRSWCWILTTTLSVRESVCRRRSWNTCFVTAVGDRWCFPTSAIVTTIHSQAPQQVPPWHINGAIHFRTHCPEGEGLSPCWV